MKLAQAGLLVIWAPQAEVLNDAVPTHAGHALVERWSSAFNTRVVVDVQTAVDISRTSLVGAPLELEWLAELK
ncbi:hypothetical protein D3C72_2507520 [compost metagenome]